MVAGRFEYFGRCLDRCESPVERRFLAALLFDDAFSFQPIPGDAGIVIAEDVHGVVLGMQVPVSNFRLDLALKRHASTRRVAVEIDGFRFHDGTPEGAERDRARDRVLTGLGWTVVRFAAREVVRDALACAKEAHALALKVCADGEVARPVLAKATEQPARQLTLAKRA